MKHEEKIVLVVEDDPTSNRLFVSICEMHGWTAISAMTVKDGKEGLNRNPSCIILDLMLPDGDGEDVMREAHRKGQNVGVIVQTGNSDHNRLKTLKELGPHAILQKPVDCDQLIRLLDDCHQIQLAAAQN